VITDFFGNKARRTEANREWATDAGDLRQPTDWGRSQTTFAIWDNPEDICSLRVLLPVTQSRGRLALAGVVHVAAPLLPRMRCCRRQTELQSPSISIVVASGSGLPRRISELQYPLHLRSM
jgi:hypothetical protein